MKKNDRLELIRKIVQENKITTQGELVKLLAEGLGRPLKPQAMISMKLVLPRYQRKYLSTSMAQLPCDERVILLRCTVACCVDRQHAFMTRSTWD